MTIDHRYRLVRCLWEGAMDWVWLARHQDLGVLLALKIIKPEFEGEPTGEARITASLRHPAIVSVFDSGLTPFGHAFFAMEHLTGSTLSEVLRRDGRLCARAAVELLLPILDALQYCHERGIVHCDLKPANIFLARQLGRTWPKLLDFGVAREPGVVVSQSEVAGTPGYIAPELVECSGLDHRVDLWAFCAVLYEAVAGHPAVHGENGIAPLSATMDDAVEPLADRGGRESVLWQVLDKGLRKQAIDRYQTAGALRRPLVQWLSEEIVDVCDACQEPRVSAVRARRRHTGGLGIPPVAVVRSA